MTGRLKIPKRVTAILVYMRPPLVFCGLLCAIAVMWTRDPVVYTFGVVVLFVSMSFDVVDGWFAARYHPFPILAKLADSIMDKVVYSIIFPLVAVGVYQHAATVAMADELELVHRADMERIEERIEDVLRSVERIDASIVDATKERARQGRLIERIAAVLEVDSK